MQRPELHLKNDLSKEEEPWKRKNKTNLILSEKPKVPKEILI